MGLPFLYIQLGILSTASGWVEMPKFTQMQLLYPGYHMHGGHYRDQEIINLIGGNNHTLLKSHDTASLRLSYALNRYGGRHLITKSMLQQAGVDSGTYKGADRHQYIYKNTAYGPYLSAKYGNPAFIKASDNGGVIDNQLFHGKQGILHIVSYRKHTGGHMTRAGGHVGLWDCDRFHQSRNFLKETQIIAVEFWEAPDSHCPKTKVAKTPGQHHTKTKPHSASLTTESMQRSQEHNNQIPNNPDTSSQDLNNAAHYTSHYRKLRKMGEVKLRDETTKHTRHHHTARITQVRHINPKFARYHAPRYDLTQSRFE